MHYRDFGKLGLKVSALGFGMMRLPTRGSHCQVDQKATIEMLRYAIDHGLNYIDTAYVYHEGKSEEVLGRALRAGYRRRVLIATKSPIWRVERHRDFDRFLDEQLARLQTDHIDFYLLHCVQKHSWEKLLRLEVFNWAEKAQAAGRIGQLGFSFHDTFEVFREVVDAYPWTFCQLQYNYVCEEVQAGARGVEYAAAKGLAVVVMEPLFGGSLARPPQPIRQLWKNLKHPPDPVDLALRWLWDKPEVSVVLSGMSTMRQLKHNLRIADRAGVGLFSVRDRRWIERMQEKYRQLAPVPCTKCGYCLPCPQGVSIPINLELYNHAQVYKGNSRALSRNLYHAMPERQRAAACRGCGACEARCPQKIGISSLMSRAARLFA